MPRTTPLRTPIRAALVGAAALLAAAPTASAADAPTRRVDLGTTGARGVALQGISADGRSVAGWQDGVGTVIRDLVTGVTTPLGVDGTILSRSDDFNRVLVSTEQRLVVTDTDDARDAYVLDRAAGTQRLVGDVVGATLAGARLSRDGKFAVVASTSAGGAATTLRVNVDTGAAQSLPGNPVPTGSTRVQSADDAATVFATDAGIYVVDRIAAPLPAGVNPDVAAVVAQNGAYVAFLAGSGDATTVKVVTVATGVVRTVALPTWVKRQAPSLFDVTSSGTQLLLGVSQARPAGQRYTLGTVDIATGAIAQLGGDLPWQVGSSVDVTRDWAFAATTPNVAQLGTKPIPGGDIVVPPNPLGEVKNYIEFSKGCRATGFPWISKRPWIRLGGKDPLPAKGQFVVKMTSSGAVVNSFTTTPNKVVELNTGISGGFSIAATITMTDGRTLTGTYDVPTYRSEPCPGFTW